MDAVIRIERHPNDRIREYHVNRVVSQSNSESFDRPLRKRSDEYLNKVGKLGSRLVRAAMRIPGVIEVGVHPYTFRIKISPAHDWQLVEPRIVRLLEREVFPGIDPSIVRVSEI